jgi:hypothetical protein
VLVLFNDNDRAISGNDDGLDIENEEDIIITPQINQIHITVFISKIQEASLEYKKLYYADYEDPRLKREIISLNRIQCEPTYIFLIQFMKLQYDLNTKVIVIKLLASLMLRRHICKKQTGETDFIFSNLVRVIGPENNPDEFIRKIKDFVLSNDYYPSDDEFMQHLVKYDFKGKAEDRARALLLFYNTSLGNGLNEFQIANPDEVHLEHIIPQIISGKTIVNGLNHWVNYLGADANKKHKSFVSRIGNLTLVSSVLNIRISNNSFEFKKEGYRQSDIHITRQLIDYAEFKFAQIEQRSNLISAVIVRNWRVD